MIERRLVFANGQAYDIAETKAYINLIFNRCDDDEFPISRKTEIDSILDDLVFMIEVDIFMFIPDPYTGILTDFSIWFGDHGQRDRTLEWFEDSLGTLETVDMIESDSESEIDDEEEWELIDAAHVLATIGSNPEEDDVSSWEECISNS